MKKHLFICASAAAMAFASHAVAGEEGAYASFGAGWNGPDDSELTGSYSTGLPGGNSSLNYDSGFGVMGALGYDFGNSLRTELELSHRDNDIPAITRAANGAGDLNVTALLLNFIWDVEIDAPVTPYIGGGIGGAYVEANALATAPAVRALNIADEDYALAYQGIVGVAYEVAENLALDLSYRYFATDDLDFTTTVPGSTVSTDYEAHGVFAGLRWSFAAPAPAPAPVAPVAPAPEPVMTPDDLDFTVYFDYNKSNLTDAAGALIAQAAQTALENDVDTVVVEGHTDTSGSSAYNQVLSARRAEAVRQGLIANGIPADAIVVESFGENRPATATEDGVREPLNRRAEVTISFE